MAGRVEQPAFHQLRQRLRRGTQQVKQPLIARIKNAGVGGKILQELFAVRVDAAVV